VIVSGLPESAKEVLEGASLAHLVTLNEDGSPQVTCVWAGLDGEEIVCGHLFPQRKIANIERDPRVAISFEAEGLTERGLDRYLVVYGTARIEEGGAAELLQRLAYTYIGPDVKFPPMEDPPPGFTSRITVERVAGAGPWAP
jgi:PPOX class probable F420-dependent enzyme